ncbi:MAG TPA: type I glutamate--ammonia ligase [Thermomicrobiales bacterium]|nr:type I glutamate--ammonia ligase [Thermomicrobiales bacterium]
MTKTPSEVVQFAVQNDVKFIDFRFCDLLGTWQHTTKSISDFDEDTFEGVGFDGSSIRGFQGIAASDLLLLPDATTAQIDPYNEAKTLYLICDIYDPMTMERYDRDPRGIAQRAEAYLLATGIGDTAFMGPEPEFFVFDNVQYDSNNHSSFYTIDSAEGFWNTGRDEGGSNLGHKIRPKAGYFPLPPHDTLVDLRAEMVLELEKLGIPVEVHHHEVGTAGQCEIDMRFDSLLSAADKVQTYKYVVKNTAAKHGKVATFMPKPIFADNGSGMHVHQSIWKDGVNLFADPDGYTGMSQTAMWYIGGILKHGPALMALAAPTVNSYRRLVPGYEAPVNLVYSARNRSAAVRIPTYGKGPRSRRLEFRCPDTAANPYLLFASLLLAGLDGIKNQIDPGKPTEFDLFEASAEELAKIKTVPGSLREVLAALKADHQFLLEGDVFTSTFIENWIDYKIREEVEPANLRVTPYEFYLYFDV